MILKKNNVLVKQKIIDGKVDDFRVICPSIVDKMLEVTDKKFNVCDILTDNFNLCKMHKDGIKDIVFILSMISAKAKKMFAITDVGVAITSPYLIEKYGLTIKNNSSIMTEGNVRNFINKVKYENENDNDNDKTKKLTGQLWINYFNLVAKAMLKKTKNTRVHILDCVKIPVNVKNKNYELSSVINYEGEKVRGYKLGVLRMVTQTGGLIEYIIDGTIKDNDLTLVKEKMIKLDLIKENDILIMDRGFVDIDFVLKLYRKNIKVVVPVKSNMEIYAKAVEEAKKQNKWKRHPNSKREGQEIAQVKDLKGLWIPKKDKIKKPGRETNEEINFNACVIRLLKSKNKKIAESLKKDNNLDDGEYVYIVILSTDSEMTASKILRIYEQRPEIEEDFRQIKDQWDLATFMSTKYNYIMCHICMVLLGYNIFSMFKSTKEGKEYQNRSMKSIEKEQMIKSYAPNEVFMMAICNSSFGMYMLGEFLLIFLECNKDLQIKIAHFFT